MLFARTTLTAALTAPFLINTVLAQNLPTGGSVAAGSVVIAQPSATQLNVTQSSQSAVVNWQGFSVGQGSAVNFIQLNSSSAILNRVTGSTPSTISGSITSNGQVYLVNPNGIAITSSGTVNTGGFVASTLGISDSNFMSGNRTFMGNGASAGVSNAGTISVGRGGYVALIGGTVSNSGNIMVPFGKVGLGSGELVTLDFSGDGFLQVAMPTAAGGKGALIRNSGSITANGGSVIISAATAREAARNAVNISGQVQARSIGGRSGAIVIGGGEGGNVKVSGKLVTNSSRGKGGDITVTGNNIKLRGATFDVSGKTGGGTVKVGGDFHGGGTLQQANSVSVDAATVIHADATGQGTGGEVVLWSTGTTRFQGLITATGGPNGGNGGRVEVSGLLDLDYAGTVDTRAPHGEIGSLLLDPENVTIQTAAGSPTDTCTAGTCTPSGDDSVLTVATLQAALATSSVTVNTGSSGAQAGHITVSNAVTWNSGSSLTLSAAAGITVSSGASITATNGGSISITAGSGGGISITSATISTVGTGNLNLSAPSAGAANGITLNNATISVGAGTGTISGTSTTVRGISFLGSNSLTATSGSLTVSGTATSGTGIGVSIGGGASLTTSGSVTLTAASSSGTGLNLGANSTITDQAGNLTINASSSSAIGTQINSQVNLVNSGAGSFHLNTSTSASAVNSSALFFTSGASVTSSGAITIGATSTSSKGIAITFNGTNAVTDSGGNLTINASSSAADFSTVNVNGAQTFTNSGAGSFNFNATSTGGQNGVNFASGATLTTSGALTLAATATTGAGFYFAGSNTITDSAGNLTIKGGNNTTAGLGVYGTGALAFVNSGAGTFALSGKSNATYGFQVSGGSTFAATTSSTGAVNISGAGVGTNGDINIVTTGAITLGAGTIAGSASGVSIDSSGGAVSLTGTTVAAGNGALAMASGSNSDFTLNAGTALSSSAAGSAVTVAAGRNFVNSSGSSAISASLGRWLVYSSSPGADTFGNLNSGNTAIWNTAAGASVSATGNRYVFSYQPTLTFTSTAATKVYGQNNAAALASDFSVSGYSTGVSNAFLADSSTTAYSGAAAVTSSGSAATATVAGGPYTISIAQGSLSSASGYGFAFANTGQLTVTRASLSVTGESAQNKVYDATTAASVTGGSLSGVLNGDSVTLSSADANFASANVGTGIGVTTAYAISGTGAGNYTLAQPTGFSANITPASLSVTVTNQSKVYGTTANLGTTGFTTSGLLGSDSVSGVTLSSAGSVTAAGVNGGTPYALNASAATGSGLSNYTISYVAGGLTVTPASLTVTATNQSKVYGTTANLGTTGFTTSGLLGSDSVSGVTLSSTGAAFTAGVNGGTPYTLNASAATGSGLSNYTISYVAGALTVTPASLSVSGANARNKVYDSTTAASVTGGSLSGLLNGDSVTLSAANANFTSANVGTGVGVATGYTLSGTGAGNYTLVQPVGLSANITPASLTVTATNQSKVYGTTANLGTTGFTTSGLLGSDSVSGVTLSSTGSVATAGVNGGTPYALNASAAVGSGLSNYTISYVAGSLTVIPASLVVIGAGAQNKVYDSSTAASVVGGSLWGIVNGDSVVLLSANANFASADVGTHIDVTTDYTLSGAGAGNYTLVQPVGLSADITPVTVVTPPTIPQPPVVEPPVVDPQPPVVDPQPPVVQPQPPVVEPRPPLEPQPPVVEPKPVAADVKPPLASPEKVTGCAGGMGGSGDAFALTGDGSLGGSSSSCGVNAAPKATSKPAGIIDFALSKLNPGALSEAVEKQFAEMKYSKAALSAAVATKVVAGVSIAVTAGLAAWLLRGGALLTALLSSMPLWRQFDPLAIVLRPRRRDDKDDEISSPVDRMFQDVKS